MRATHCTACEGRLKAGRNAGGQAVYTCLNCDRETPRRARVRKDSPEIDRLFEELTKEN